MTTINKVDIFIPQGTDWSYDFDVDPAIDLSGATAAMQIEDPDSGTYVATLTTSNNGLTINPSTQKITARLTNAATSILIPKEYIYDIKVADTSNKLYRAAQGNAIVDAQVTNILPPVSSVNPITTEDGFIITTEDGTKITT